jgi:CubicO group peptidase (beta-lactamase class C family)
MRKLACVLALFVCVPSLAVDTKAFDAVFAAFDKNDVPGCAAGIVHGGKVLYGRGYGMASLEHSVPINADTVFDVGSVSKEFTAALVLLLEQQKKLSLDDDVRKYVPELPDYGTPITLRHLLHHTSGLRDYNDLLLFAEFHEEDLATDADALRILAKQKRLNFTPGTDFSYSNTGYFLLSQVIKRASGKSMRDFAQEQLFAPLGMTSTTMFDDHRMVIPHRATAYAPRQRGGWAVAMSNWEQLGDGGVQTTLNDFAKWEANFDEPKVGGKALIDALLARTTLANGVSPTYARGLNVDTFRGEPRVGHNGAWAGYRASFMRFPRLGQSIVILCNRADTGGMLGEKTAALVVTKPEETKPKAAGTPAAPLAGWYVDPLSGNVVRVREESGQFFAGPLKLEANGAVWRSGPRTFRFHDDAVDVADNGPAHTLRRAAPFDPSRLADYTGRYTSDEIGHPIDIVRKGEMLVLRTDRDEEIPLQPIARDLFGGPAILEFQRDAAGKVTGLTV